MEKIKNDVTTEYIQFSKRVTHWGMVSVTLVFLFCLAAITFFINTSEAIHTVASLYTAYVTVMGVTIGAYQGNSSLEKWTKAKYQYEEATKQEE